jgi:hypothetical protein
VVALARRAGMVKCMVGVVGRLLDEYVIRGCSG